MCSSCFSILSPVDGDIYSVMVETGSQHGWEKIKGEACFSHRRMKLQEMSVYKMHIHAITKKVYKSE